MSILWMVKKGEGLYPAGAEAAAIFARLKFGRSLKVEVKEPRNAKHNALYWTLCQRIANAVGVDPQNISDLLKIEAGHYRMVRSKKYGDLRLPLSISFSAMDDSSFREFFDRCVVVICENWGNEALAAVEDLIDQKNMIGHNSRSAA